MSTACPRRILRRAVMVAVLLAGGVAFSVQIRHWADLRTDELKASAPIVGPPERRIIGLSTSVGENGEWVCSPIYED
jgi:hypothetical protein